MKFSPLCFQAAGDGNTYCRNTELSVISQLFLSPHLYSLSSTCGKVLELACVRLSTRAGTLLWVYRYSLLEDQFFTYPKSESLHLLKWFNVADEVGVTHNWTLFKMGTNKRLVELEKGSMFVELSMKETNESTSFIAQVGRMGRPS